MGDRGQFWEQGGPQPLPCTLAPIPWRPHWGAGWGWGPADRSALLARCFSVNFYGMQRSFCFVLFFGLFFFFVKLKKNLHLILELPYLKKKKEGKITKKIIKTKLGLNCSGLLFFVACLTEQHALTVPPGTSITEVLHACHVQSGDQRS